MHLIVHPADELPIYRQIMRQITEAIATGGLKPGDKLPSHRELSEELVIAPLTVKKAYDELELLGFLETHRGRGTFVCENLPRASAGQKVDQVRAAARELLSRGYLAGLNYREILKILEQEKS